MRGAPFTNALQLLVLKDVGFEEPITCAPVV